MIIYVGGIILSNLLMINCANTNREDKELNEKDKDDCGCGKSTFNFNNKKSVEDLLNM